MHSVKTILGHSKDMGDIVKRILKLGTWFYLAVILIAWTMESVHKPEAP